MSKPNYELKAQVLKTQCPKLISIIDRRNYLQCTSGIIEDKNFDVAFEEMMLVHKYGQVYVNESRKINIATYRRTERLKDRIMNYLSSGVCLFLTLTFTDEVLANTTEETRRTYVRKYLRSQSKYYVANIDYGKKNEREHYHAVILGEYIDMHKWTYGFSLVERIKNHLKAEQKLSKYITKLTNHAIKETTKRCCYIYSR